MAGACDEQVDIELNYLYRAVSAPTEKLYLSYAGKDSAGGSMQLCAEVAAFTEALGLEPKERSDAFGIVNQRTAEIRYADALDREKRELMKALEDSEAGDACRELILTAERRDRKIADRELAARLAGDRQRLSAFNAVDAFMLGAVIHKGTLDILHPGDQEHIGKENQHADHGLH